MKKRKTDKEQISTVNALFKMMRSLEKKYPKDIGYCEYLVFVIMGTEIKRVHGTELFNEYIREIKKKASKK